MIQPPGFETNNNQVCKLNKSIYGLKQSPRCWNSVLNQQLVDNGYQRSISDPCLYSKEINNEIVFIACYVDDILISSSSEKLMQDSKNILMNKFKIKDLGKLKYFLGIEVKDDHDSIFIGQQAYINRILSEFDMQNCNSVSTPVDKSQVNSCTTKESIDANEVIDQKYYQKAIGSLLYLSTKTRPRYQLCCKLSSQRLQ